MRLSTQRHSIVYWTRALKTRLSEAFVLRAGDEERYDRDNALLFAISPTACQLQAERNPCETPLETRDNTVLIAVIELEEEGCENGPMLCAVSTSTLTLPKVCRANGPTLILRIFPELHFRYFLLLLIKSQDQIRNVYLY